MKQIWYRIWVIWHSRLRDWFDYLDARVKGKDPKEWKYGIRGISGSRPHWHLCCNGNPGGWRTTFCDYLEHKWRRYDDD